MNVVHSVASQARLLTLLRLLLLAIGLGTITLFASTHLPLMEGMEGARWLLVGVCMAAAALAATTGWVRGRWQLALHLVFDLLWIGMLLFWTGSTSSPGVILLFAVVLIGNLVLPGFLRFLLPALAGMVLAITAAFYLSGRSPFPPELAQLSPDLFAPGRLLGNLAVQIGGLFLVDLLGGLLSRRLIESRVFAGGVLDQLGEGVLAIDRLGNIAYANAESARLLGLGTAPAPGTPAVVALAGDALAPVRELFAAERLPVLERWRGPGGRQLVLRVTELHGRSRPIGRTLVIADETRLRVLENSARRAESLAALGEMAAGIAHEVRNPLTSLRGCAQELAEVATRSGRQDDAQLARVIVSESDRLARIVGDFLELSRMRPPLRTQVDLGPVLREITTLTNSRPDLPAGLEVMVDLAVDCPPVYADPDQIRQVLLNLVANALEALHGRPAGRLRLAAAPAGEDNPLDHKAVRLLVTDNGIGIPAEQMERVFTPFWSTKPQGTGLGLSLVSRILREHEGVLRIDSESGVGTEVTVFLPTISQSRSFKRALGGH
jgi:signal transduction histidine kinase